MSYRMKCLNIIVVISFLTGCGGSGGGGGEKPSSGNNDDVSQSQQFKYPDKFQNFENFKAGGIPLERNLFELTFLGAFREKLDLEATLMIENNPAVNRSHCEKGTANGIELTLSEDGGSYSGEFIYTKSSGVMIEPLIPEEEVCSYSDFLDGVITFKLNKTGEETYKSSTTFKGPFFIRDSGGGYFDGATAYTGSFVSELTANGTILTSPSMEVFTVVSPDSKQPYDKEKYSEEDKVYFKNYRHSATTISTDITEVTVSFEAQWHENNSDFVLFYDSKSTRKVETLTLDESYRLEVPGDDSKMIEGTVHRVIYNDSGRVILNSTWIKDGKTKTEEYDSNDFLNQ